MTRRWTGACHEPCWFHRRFACLVQISYLASISHDTFIFWFVTDESLLFLYNSSVSSTNCWTLPMIKPYWILVFDNQIYEESGVLFVQPPSGLTRIGIIHLWPFPLSCEPCRESWYFYILICDRWISAFFIQFISIFSKLLNVTND